MALACVALHSGSAQTIALQPIVVCNQAGNICTENLLQTRPELLQAANTIFSQAGLSVGQVLTVRKILDPNFNDPLLGFREINLVEQNGNPIDEGRQLLRGIVPGLGISARSNVLNVVSIDELREVKLGAANAAGDAKYGGGDSAAGTGLVGFGFINANGIIIDRGARIDTLAHEIGHNYGLLHTNMDPLVPDDPRNLMTDGGRRDSPPSVAAIKPAGSFVFDQLVASQITEIRNPLFTYNLASVDVRRVSLGPCNILAGLANCLLLKFNNNGTTEKQKSLTLNFTSDATIDPNFRFTNGAFAFEGDPLQLPVGTLLPVDPSTGAKRVKYDFTNLPGGGLQPGQGLFTYIGGLPDGPAIDPLSLFFEFSGTLTTALYDANGTSTDRPLEVVFLEAPESRDALSLSLIGEDAPESAVPAPGTFLLLASAVTAFARRRRRG